MKNKAQSAMEYLMTYGWAILIVIVVVAALYSMGVFSSKGGVSCSPCFGYFAFVDYDQGAGTLVIRNGARTINNVTVSQGTANLCTTTTPCQSGTDITITGITNTAGTTQTIDITYNDVSSTLGHTDSATIHNK
jgi:hypothetical protein